MHQVGIHIVDSGDILSIGLRSICRYDLPYLFIHRFLPVIFRYGDMGEVRFFDTYPDDSVFHLGEVSIDSLHTL